MNKELQHEEICVEMHQTYVAKNSDYGSAFEKLFAEVGPMAAYTKVADKFYRVQQLWKNPEAAQVQESLRDSLLDMANYCILWVLEMDSSNVTQNKVPCPKCGKPAQSPNNDHAGYCEACQHIF